MAIDHAGQNIRVNTLSPGAVETAAHRAPLRLVRGRARRRLGPKHLLGRLGQPDEIAGSGGVPRQRRGELCHRQRPVGRRRLHRDLIRPSTTSRIFRPRQRRGLARRERSRRPISRPPRPAPPSSDTANSPSTRPRCCRSMPRTTRRNPSNGAASSRMSSEPHQNASPCAASGRDGAIAGMDEQQPALFGERGVAQRREQRDMAGCGVHRAAQCSGPAGDRARPVAGRGEALPQIAAIGRDRRLDPGPDHPGQHLAGIGRELQLQQLLPHLLLRAAQEDDIAGKCMPARPARGGGKSSNSSMVASTASP